MSTIRVKDALKEKDSAETREGIYVIFHARSAKCLYVGKTSRGIYRRIREHYFCYGGLTRTCFELMTQGDYADDLIRIVGFSECQRLMNGRIGGLRALEREFIELYKPSINIQHSPKML